MRIAVPTEVKNHEYRVALTPVGVAELVAHGHQVAVQAGAGVGSSFTDEEYRAQGATIIDDPDEVWGFGEVVVKVKEPLPEEHHRLRDDLALFTYLHLAAAPECTEALLAAGTTAIAYETVQLATGALPLLQPMSEVAGTLAPQVGAMTLTRHRGGRGMLLGGISGVASAKVLVLGGGTAGQTAANIAAGMGADVTILDTDMDKLRTSFWRFQNRVHQLASSRLALAELVPQADLVIGTVLIPGAKTPKLVTDEMVQAMKTGAVLVDVAIDQGGCFEHSRPTTHADPTFTVHDTVFYCVTNMPGAVPNTSTYALTNATLPYLTRIAEHGWREAMRRDEALAKGLNTHAGAIVHPAVAQAFGRDHTDIAEVLSPA
ncbi:alanine dehydrogenase [Aestuariimicrobium ganziense]|uniref:alanine dehydrogenase n=1 Tax=Aestuariimicrobium ganziense TaxID=2773677 RepID=UPI001941E626|nr:alanine dehydrogenase [Aestuariimicrobium ganziense]